LRRAGWRVLRVWEHEVEDDARSCAVRIAAFVGQSVDVSQIDVRIASLPVLKRRKRLPKP
jgi:G:T-mismatch repair DNA endonuclease (very short patch repair protein)